MGFAGLHPTYEPQIVADGMLTLRESMAPDLAFGTRNRGPIKRQV